MLFKLRRIPYDARCYFRRLIITKEEYTRNVKREIAHRLTNARSKADISQLSLQHGTNN